MGNKATNKKKFFSKAVEYARQHPVLFNLLMVILVGFGVVWMSLIALDIWTDHGNYKVVPSLRGLTYKQAQQALATAQLSVELSDSVYDTGMPPGTVVEQSPRPNTKVKTDRIVYLTVTAFTPKMVSLPRLTDMSERQARSALEGIGLTSINVQPIASDYKDLVLGVKYNGLPIQPGTRIPASASITIEVGMGHDDEVIDSISFDDVDSLESDLDFTNE